MSLFSSIDLAWIQENYFLLVLSFMVGLQWIALQGFAIHYIISRPKPVNLASERKRLATLEGLVDFQSTQIERLYAKTAELTREISSIYSVKTSSKNSPSPSLEQNFMTFGEVALKKRLSELSRAEEKSQIPS